MITRDLAKQLTRKFTGRAGFPRSDNPEGKAALAALFDAFQNYCVSENHARHVAEDLDVETRFCPTTAEIYRVAMATRPTMRRRSDDCPRCASTGFLRVALDHGGVEVGGVRPCGCRTSQAVVDGVSDGLGV